jgi:hypothetical protein
MVHQQPKIPEAKSREEIARPMGAKRTSNTEVESGMSSPRSTQSTTGPRKSIGLVRTPIGSGSEILGLRRENAYESILQMPATSGYTDRFSRSSAAREPSVSQAKVISEPSSEGLFRIDSGNTLAEAAARLERDLQDNEESKAVADLLKASEEKNPSVMDVQSEEEMDDELPEMEPEVESHHSADEDAELTERDTSPEMEVDETSNEPKLTVALDSDESM